MSQDKFILNANGSFEYITTNISGTIYPRSKRFNPTTLVCNIQIKNNKLPNKTARVNLDLFDDTSINSKLELLGNSLEISTNTIQSDLKLFALKIEKILAQSEEIEKVSINEKEAKIFLKQKDLIPAIESKLSKFIVGQNKTSTLNFLIAVSYKSTKPLHSILSAESSSGKSYLLEKVTEFLPPEDVVTYTAMTKSSIPNLKNNELQNKCVVIEDLIGIDRNAEFYLREIQTKGSISVSKFSHKHGHTITKKIDAHCSTISATTKGRNQIYRDNENRSFFLKLDESKEQIEKVLEFKSQLKAGLIDNTIHNKFLNQIRNAIRFLKPFDVINPFASHIIIPEACKDRTRLQDLLLGLIDVITFIHQLQRKRDNKGRLITEIQDVQLALDLTIDMFFYKADELSKSNRIFLEELKGILKEKSDDELTKIEFKVEDVLDKTNSGNSSIYRKIKLLQEKGLIIQIGGNQRIGNIYRLLFDDEFENKKVFIKQQLFSVMTKIKTSQV